MRLIALQVLAVLVLSVTVHAQEPCSGPPLLPFTESPFTVVSPLNPKAAVAVLGIVPTKSPGTMSPQRAASLARFAQLQFRHLRRPRFQIFVFADMATGLKFGRHQLRRGSAALAPRDFVALQKLWPRTLAFYEFVNRRERVLYPSRVPGNWWKRIDFGTVRKQESASLRRRAR